MDKSKFLERQPPEVMSTDIPGLGEVFFRRVYGSERIQKYDLWLPQKGDKSYTKKLSLLREKLISVALCDKHGNSFEFTEAELQAMSDNLHADQLTQMAEVAQKCLGLSDDDLGDKIKKKSDDLSGAQDGTSASS